ncbi:hypothetical protein SAMN02745824_2973 [Parasphingorhabdus marina DSM 22363]|uniref:DUF2927 domain-containing protein n=1 Tax=Parasphingorhabdus marina DSM 22363 TaxID=1123272 RepID=A0A1N6GTD4_9SPHN|nr:hypothetical protein [Parasphingorhabdus marina]SIO10742.1 hypothetical protein SAMN02745824_2973 [Parasphingorhabdus marina DSM 22363]
MKSASGALLPLFLLSAFPATATEPERPGVEAEEKQANEPIVVTGQDIRDATRSFVKQLRIPEYGGQYARWEAPLCLQMIGWQKEHAANVKSLIERLTREIGHDVAGADCRPNMAIVLSPDPKRFVDQLRKSAPRIFTRFSRSQRRAATEGNQPVRLLLGARDLNKDGQPIHFAGALAPPPGLEALGGISESIVRGGGVGNSRIGTTVKSDFVAGVAVVDVHAIDGATFEGLSSYLAMRLLSGVPGSRIPDGGETILQLFQALGEEAQPPTKLSRWDMAFLRGLYGSTAAARSVQQRGEIIRSMRKSLALP